MNGCQKYLSDVRLANPGSGSAKLTVGFRLVIRFEGEFGEFRMQSTAADRGLRLPS